MEDVLLAKAADLELVINVYVRKRSPRDLRELLHEEILKVMPEQTQAAAIEEGHAMLSSIDVEPLVAMSSSLPIIRHLCLLISTKATRTVERSNLKNEKRHEIPSMPTYQSADQLGA